MQAVKHKEMTDSNGRRYIPDHFIYRAAVTNIAANGGQASAIVNIEANSDFVWVKSAYVADIAGAAQTDSSRVIPLVRVAINDSGSGTNLQISPIPISALAGHEGLPLNIAQPRIFSGSSQVSFTFSNYSADTVYANVELMLIGYRKIYL